MLFYRRVTRHLGVFSQIFPASSLFRITRHKFSALKTCFNAETRSNSPLSTQRSSSPLPIQRSSSTHHAGGQTLPSPPSVHPPCWWPTSPLPTQRSSSTHPAGGQTLPSQPSSHPSPLLSANLTPPHLVVILHPCWRPTSPLHTQRSWRSNSTLSAQQSFLTLST